VKVKFSALKDHVIVKNNGVMVDIDADFVDHSSLELGDTSKLMFESIIRKMNEKDVLDVFQNMFDPEDLIDVSYDERPEIKWI